MKNNEEIKKIEKDLYKKNEKLFLPLKWYELQSVSPEQPPIRNNSQKTSDDETYIFKVIVLGKPEKTAFIIKFVTGFSMEDLRKTIPVDFEVKKITVDGKEVTLRIWDFASEERFKSMLPQYIEGSDGAILMYDVIDAKTLNTISEIIELVKKNAGNIPIFLNAPEVPSKAEEFENFTKKYKFTEIPSDTGLTGENIFRILTKKMLEYEYT
ncbi:MAG: Rab family GTPase [Candidatus Thorarchaeota archaeon]